MSGEQGALRVSCERLIFMGLAALYQVTEQCHQEPHRRGVALRVTMAMLFAFSDGRRAPYTQFWQICGTCDSTRDPQGSALKRGAAVRAAFHEICRTLNVRETGFFVADLKNALNNPGNAMRGTARSWAR